MGYEEISWTEASSEKSEVVGCVHEKIVLYKQGINTSVFLDIIYS